MDDLLVERIGFTLVLTLNRPQASNALNRSMIDALNQQLDQAIDDETIVSIFIKGAGDKAFCAGGDIKAARLAAIAMREGKDGQGGIEFFAAEYALNHKLFHYPKPVIAFMDGITMGGGVGLSAPCSYRIATPKTMWAMPEVGIGFFPDVGAAYYLNKFPGCVGVYLAITGTTISNTKNLLKCGCATHYSSKEEGEWIAALSVCADRDALDDAVRKLSVQPSGTFDLPYQEIDDLFAGESAAEIMRKLETGSEWAQNTAKLIRAKSPISVSVALRNLQISRRQDFDQVNKRDLDLAIKFMLKGDMIEGIRAVVVDKDHQPKWNPSRLEDVSEQELNWYFK